MGEELPDDALMRRVAYEDTTAFDALFLRHRRAVFSFLFRMVADWTAAEDLTQECFLRVWQARHRYQPAGVFRTWLFTIARRLALDELKKRPAPTETLATDTLDEGNLPMPAELAARIDHADPLDVVMARDLARRIDREVDCLPEELREVVLFRDMEAMSYEQMATLIGCPLGTVKSRLNAARRRLRAAALAWFEEKAT